MRNELDRLGYSFIEAGTDQETIKVVSRLSENKLNLSRNVIISSLMGNGDLAASNEEFFYHTDATFQKIPPKYIALQLLNPCEGGEIRMFDSALISKYLTNEAYFFGQGDQKIVAKIQEKSPEGSFIFRYRRDYMTSISNDSALNHFHDRLLNATQESSISLGYIPLGKILVINNWKFLHMRGSFTGERTIRRFWFDYAGQYECNPMSYSDCNG